MSIRYNDTDEFNSIETGNTVYISGLPGKNFSLINNKHGLVKDIYLTYDNNRISYMARILLIENNEECIVNFDYIFKVGHKMNHYVIKKNLKDCYPMQDENGQLLAICNDFEGRKHVFLYSGIN
jgi:hypothetical protein